MVCVGLKGDDPMHGKDLQFRTFLYICKVKQSAQCGLKVCVIQGWTLSNDYDLQPRLSAEWRPAVGHTFNIGLGRTSRIENMETLLAAAGNLDLKMVRSNQAIIGYKWQPRNELCFNIEAWAEYLTNVPVSPTGTYCVFNRRLFYSAEPLVSKGHGCNIGIGANVEHYMTKGYYFLVNASVFRSEYRAIGKVDTKNHTAQIL